MASEIKLTTGLRVDKDNLSYSRANKTQSIDMAGDAYSAGVQNIGTTYEAVDISAAVGTAGVAVFKNLDATNYVEIGLEVSAAFHAFAKIKPGEEYSIRLATNSIFAKADTGAINLETFIVED